MKTRTALALVAAAISTGCASASGPQSLPDRHTLNRVSTVSYNVGSVANVDQLLHILPRTLARYGYFILETHERSGGGYEFITDWRDRPVNSEEAFDGVQQARTRLIVDANRRGNRYAISIYAVSFLADQNGNWREATVSQPMKELVRQVGITMAADVTRSSPALSVLRP